VTTQLQLINIIIIIIINVNVSIMMLILISAQIILTTPLFPDTHHLVSTVIQQDTAFVTTHVAVP